MTRESKAESPAATLAGGSSSSCGIFARAARVNPAPHLVILLERPRLFRFQAVDEH